MTGPHDEDRDGDARDDGDEPAGESEPTTSGHSTADTQAERNREDESPG